jgi:GlpG protein
MRCLGQINNRKEAEKFVAYCLTEGITTQVEPVPDSVDQWEIWVRDEDRLNQAIGLLAEFEKNPADPKYHTAIQHANAVLQERAKQRQALAQNIRKVRYQSHAMSDRRIPPLTLTLLILSCLVSIANNFGRPSVSNEIGQSISRQLGFVDFTGPNAVKQKSGRLDPLADIKKGQIWRLITPIFIHLSTIHLAFNAIGLVVLGRIVERWLGTGLYAMFILVAAVFPNLLQALAPPSLMGSPLFGGISGVVYALFGLVWMRSVLNPMLGIRVPFIYVALMILPIVIGISGAIPGWNHAELCHLGGLVIGLLVAYMMEHR